MTFILLRTNIVVRASRKTIQKQPELAKNLHNTLELLSIDPFHPRLKTHKLKGDLQNSWACSVSYDIRVIFKFVDNQGSQSILLESIGTHDEVY